MCAGFGFGNGGKYAFQQGGHFGTQGLEALRFGLGMGGFGLFGNDNDVGRGDWGGGFFQTAAMQQAGGFFAADDFGICAGFGQRFGGFFGKGRQFGGGGSRYDCFFGFGDAVFRLPLGWGRGFGAAVYGNLRLLGMVRRHGQTQVAGGFFQCDFAFGARGFGFGRAEEFGDAARKGHGIRGDGFAVYGCGGRFFGGGFGCGFGVGGGGRFLCGCFGVGLRGFVFNQCEGERGGFGQGGGCFGLL